MSTARATHPVHGFARPMGISPMAGTYNGAELATKPARATSTRELPTRVGNRLHWKDGRVTDLDGMPLAVAKTAPTPPPAPAVQQVAPPPQAPASGQYRPQRGSIPDQVIQYLTHADALRALDGAVVQKMWQLPRKNWLSTFGRCLDAGLLVQHGKGPTALLSLPGYTPPARPAPAPEPAPAPALRAPTAAQLQQQLDQELQAVVHDLVKSTVAALLPIVQQGLFTGAIGGVSSATFPSIFTTTTGVSP